MSQAHSYSKLHEYLCVEKKFIHCWPLVSVYIFHKIPLLSYTGFNSFLTKKKKKNIPLAIEVISIALAIFLDEYQQQSNEICFSNILFY